MFDIHDALVQDDALFKTWAAERQEKSMRHVTFTFAFFNSVTGDGRQAKHSVAGIHRGAEAERQYNTTLHIQSLSHCSRMLS